MIPSLPDPTIWNYLSMPVITAIVGYITNVAAIWMMFHPVRFVGIKRLRLGWQGVVPRRASTMSGIAVDTIVGPLITREDIVGRLDADALAERLRHSSEELADAVVDEIASQYFPTTWESMPASLKAQARRRVRQQAPWVVRDLIADLQGEIDSLLDLKHLVTHALIADKRLLNHIFKQIGHREFVFIARAGGIFGFLFGLIQMSVWAAWQPWWLLPVFGALVGGATNWVALKMIFNPRQPRRIGPFRVQGVFFRRQAAVAGQYGRLVAERLLTPDNLASAIFTGPRAYRFRARVAARIERGFDDALGPLQPLGWLAVGRMRRALIRGAAANSLARGQQMIEANRDDLTRRIGLADLLADRLRSLAPVDFERMLRPAFEQDEWLLILAGAALGTAAGVFQLITLFTSVIVHAL
ncbi:DUF445 domain-containing protein [Salinisphaera orenii]|uniref:DUF445 domain-containing protein n=1 Tax=Salinisphaera orenii TaxID=856731 RepID=UPI000DBE7AB7